MTALSPPYLLFLGDAQKPLDCKTARGMVEWGPEQCLGEYALESATETVGLSRLTPLEAANQGAKTLLIGTVSAGGMLPGRWLYTLHQAIDAGLHIASGMHQFLRDRVDLVNAAARRSVELVDVRDPDRWTGVFNGGEPFKVGSGQRRAGLRLLTVGTDCSIGKMYSALAIERHLRGIGVPAQFKATGQTGIFIAGQGVPVDAMVGDFISGAVEALSPADPGSLHVIEGQGSLHHPGFAGVSLGLLHGAQPDYLVVCHEPTRTHMRHAPHVAMPSLAETVELNLLHARRTNPKAQVLGFSINTQHLDQHQAAQYLQSVEQEFQLPAVDPARPRVSPEGSGVAALLSDVVDRLRTDQ